MGNPRDHRPPETVIFAVWFIYASATLGGVFSLAFGVWMLGGLLGAALTFWIAMKVRAGRNWARLLILVVNVLGLFSGIVSLFALPGQSTTATEVVRGFVIVGCGISLFTVVLLSVRDSREYFARMSIVD